MLYKLEGIVIRSMDYGENNKIIAIYTRHNGKMSIMVRGAKKLNSRFSAVTQLFTHGEFVLFKGSSMGSLIRAKPLNPIVGLERICICLPIQPMLLSLLIDIVPELDANEMMFEQLKASLEAIESGKEPAIVLHYGDENASDLQAIYLKWTTVLAAVNMKVRWRLVLPKAGILCQGLFS